MRTLRSHVHTPAAFPPAVFSQPVAGFQTGHVLPPRTFLRRILWGHWTEKTAEADVLSNRYREDLRVVSDAEVSKNIQEVPV